MKYYIYENLKIRTDAKTNKAYVKNKSGEKVIPKASKLTADAILENNQITKAQYDK